MPKLVNQRPSPALVISMIALFVALGSGAYAASKIDTQDIKKRAVTGPKIDKDAIKSGKVKNGKLKGKDLADETISESKLGEGVVSTDKIQDAAITGAKIAPEAVASGNIAPEAVETGNIAPLAVDSDKLASDSVGGSELRGITVASNTSTSTPDGSSAGVTATCPSGQVIAGGFETEGPGADVWTVKRLLRFGNGWRVFGTNDSGGNSTITAFAYCLD